MDETSEAPPPAPPPPPARRAEVPGSVKDALYLAALQQVDRVANTADGMRLQAMLGGFETMLLDEEAETGRMPESDSPAVRAFHQHLGAALRISRGDAERRVDTARTLRDRLPVTWGVLLDGRATERAATVAADQVRGLTDPAHLAVYDRKAAELVVEEIPTVIERELATLRDALDPEAAIARHRAAANRRRIRARATGDGMGVLEVHTTAEKVAAISDRIRHDAVAAHGRDGECRSLGQLAADRAADLLLGAPGGTVDDPTWPMDPAGQQGYTATILVTMTAETATGASDAPATVAGTGSLDAEAARNLVAHARTWTRAVIDPVDDAIIAFDSHERYIPAALKKLIHLRMPTCAGDDCGLPSHRADLDHAIRVEHDGRTRHLNLHPLCRYSHQMKDDGFCDVIIDPTGTPRWKYKWGATRKARVAFKARPTGPHFTYPDDPPF